MRPGGFPLATGENEMGEDSSLSTHGFCVPFGFQ
ncbi:hypothetical protein Mal15_04170 [Stieleria maiorica]|uniref:Uncharacterized protein n=1 Tax=Stieleria maiorica TaxID=2795974 RepID=A0A5B9M6D6_9BACT|nr:hypothetical protein Mal15_04170 [Stieleria maiorica]